MSIFTFYSMISYAKYFIVAITAISISCSDSNSTDKETISEATKQYEGTDTIQSILYQRKATSYKGNIFGGLILGCSKSDYERTVKQFIAEYDNQLYIEVDDHPKSFPIRSMTPKFYKNRLSQLEITIEGTHAKYELEPIFIEKYGKVEENIYDKNWVWNNMEIILAIHPRTEVDPVKYFGTHSKNNPIYFDEGSRITKIPGYTVILYKDLNLLKMQNEEMNKTDSIKRERERQKREMQSRKDSVRASNFRNNI